MLQGEGGFQGVFFPINLNSALFCRNVLLVCEKLTIFPYGKYIVGNIISLAFSSSSKWRFAKM